MSTKDMRGTKRSCQSASCQSRFYDLNRDPIVCPVCGTIYELAMAMQNTGATAAPDKVSKRPPKKAEFTPAATPADAPEVEGDDALVDIEAADDALDDAADDATFLEAEEEDGGDVTGIIGGPVAEGEEEV